MFIFDFVAETILDQILDWIYGKIIGFLNDFFVMMNNMGVELFEFLDMIAPSVIQFYTDHYICGNTYRSVWALREYPTATDEQAILRHLGEKDGVTLRIYTRQVTPAEEKKIISNAANKNRMKQGNTENLQERITKEN